MRRRKGLRIVGGATLVAILLIAFVASRGKVETYASDPPTRLDVGAGTAAGAAARGEAPAWTAPCQTRPPRKDRPFLAGCARVSGRVVWIGRHKHDPHVIVLARFGLIVGKLDLLHVEPGFGEHVTMIGPLVRARGGLREVDVVSLR